MHWPARSLSFVALLRLSLAGTLRIDDSDPGVQYDDLWTNGDDIPDDTSLNWDGTLHYSNISGATAILNFTGELSRLRPIVTYAHRWPGTSIAVFGSFHPPGRYSMESRYSIDSQPPFAFIPSQEVSAPTHQTLFYSSPQFLYGQHTLVITNLGEQLFIDFFDVQNDSEITTPKSPSATTTSSKANSPLASIAAPTLSSDHGSPTTTNSTSVSIMPTITPVLSSRNATLPTTAIAGVSIACALFLALAGMTVWFRSKHNGRADSKLNNPDVSGGQSNLVLIYYYNAILGQKTEKLTTSSTDGVPVVDPSSPRMVTAVTSIDDRRPTVNAPLAPCPSTPTNDVFRTPLLAVSQDSPSPDSPHKDDAPKAASPSHLFSSSGLSADTSHLFDSDRQRLANVYAPSLGPDTATTASNMLLGMFQLPSLPSHSKSDVPGGVRISPVPDSFPDDEHATLSVSNRREQSRRVQEDGGVRLAGGPPGEARVEDYLGGWGDLPPPYQRF